MRVNHRFDARARLSTVSAVDLERRYAFAPVDPKISNIVQVAASALPDISAEQSDNNRLIANLDVSFDLPAFARLTLNFDGVFNGGGLLSIVGSNLISGPDGYELSAPSTLSIRLSDSSQNTHPNQNPGTRNVTYVLSGINVALQIETINADAKFKQTLDRALLFADPMTFTRSITDYYDNP